MPEGTSAFMGRGVGLRGNYEIQGDNDTDDTLTITGASSSAAGDILVLQNSTGTEFLSVSSSGLFTFSNTGAAAFSGPISAVLASSALDGVSLSVTSTGAIAAGGITPSGFTVHPSSKSVMAAAFLYDADVGSAPVGTVSALLAVSGSKNAPSYLVSVGVSSTWLEGAAANNGFFSATARLASSVALSTLTPFAVMAVTSGSYVYYIPCFPNTGVTVA